MNGVIFAQKRQAYRAKSVFQAGEARKEQGRMTKETFYEELINDRR